MGDLPPKAEHLIKVAHRNSVRLIALVNDILDMNKLAAGALVLDMQSHDLVAIGRLAIEANLAYAKEFHVELHFSASAEEMLVLADAGRVLQVFANLISNAVKFSHHGGGKSTCIFI